MACMKKLADKIKSIRYFEITMLIYLAGFFFFPSSNLHKNYFYAAILTPYLLTFQFAEVKHFLHSPLYRWVVVFLIYITVSIFWNPVTQWQEYFKYAFRLMNSLVFITVICRLVVNDRLYIDKVWTYLVWVAGAMALISIIVFYADHSFPLQRLQNWGPLYHPIVGGTCYGIAAIICYFHFLRNGPQTDWSLYGFILFVLLVDIWMTMSRGVWLGLIVGFFVGEFIRRNYWLTVLPVVLVVAYSCLVYLDIIEASWFFVRDGGDSYRIAAWKWVLEKVSAAPWFGYGVNVDEAVPINDEITLVHAHSIYISNLLYGGVVAGVLLCIIVITCILEGLKQTQINGSACYIAMTIFVFVCVATDNNTLLLNPVQIWFYTWFPIAILVGGQIRQLTVDQRSQIPL